MPLALVLLLWLGLSARGGRSCLQCVESVRESLSKLRFALVPQRFDQERLQARAQSLLLGMEGPFFREYALNTFVGKVGTTKLEYVASFVNNRTKAFMDESVRDEPLLEQLVTFRRDVLEQLKKALKDYQAKDILQEEVLDCFLCQRITPQCIKYEYCFVDRQPRMALQYGSRSQNAADPAKFGIIFSVCLAIFLFLVIVFSPWVLITPNKRLEVRVLCQI
ncbi:izumo sperm-egg fusion protein 2 [Rhynchocyon petersi]